LDQEFPPHQLKISLKMPMLCCRLCPGPGPDFRAYRTSPASSP
jgi:hypothetical protein